MSQHSTRLCDVRMAARMDSFHSRSNTRHLFHVDGNEDDEDDVDNDEDGEEDDEDNDEDDDEMTMMTNQMNPTMGRAHFLHLKFTWHRLFEVNPWKYFSIVVTPFSVLELASAIVNRAKVFDI